LQILGIDELFHPEVAVPKIQTIIKSICFKHLELEETSDNGGRFLAKLHLL